MKTIQDEIQEGVAEFNYYYPDGKPCLRRKWELLSAEERKPYLDVARLQVSKLHYQGVRVVKEKELPKPPFPDGQDDELTMMYALAQQDMLKWHKDSIERLI